MEILLPQVLTQIVGFLLLLWLLRRYAWGPLLQTLEDRRSQIANEQSEIAASKEGVRQLQQEYEAKMHEIKKEALLKVQEAILEGQKVAREITTSARKEADALLEKGKENISREMGLAKIQLRNEVAELVIATAAKVIRKELDAERNKELVLQYMDELN
ncbi:MAG: F0F1 ATP synthase subunit B [Nitrospirae bacterium]|nr:F0F1 ATP synthase subunit B [Candidatus Troglogloeales bacterium]MBI3598728.1 F0F1 ATP synthase subunit B [Candidatus Troglogloeales bacterium]